MAFAERHDRYFILAALIWATAGGALIGGAVLTVAIILDGSANGIYEAPWLAAVAPFVFAALSLLVVFPCTFVFGVPSALLVDHFALGKWPALAVCLACAVATQIACVWLVFWDEYSEVSQFLFTTPFAMGAATVLWWRITRP